MWMLNDCFQNVLLCTKINMGKEMSFILQRKQFIHKWKTFKTTANLPRSVCPSKFLPRPYHTVHSGHTAKKIQELHLRGLKLLKGSSLWINCRTSGLMSLVKMFGNWQKNYTQHISTNGWTRDDDFDLFCSHGAWAPIWSQMWGQSPDLNWIEMLLWGFKKAVKANSHKPQLTEAAL